MSLSLAGAGAFGRRPCAITESVRMVVGAIMRLEKKSVLRDGWRRSQRTGMAPSKRGSRGLEPHHPKPGAFPSSHNTTQVRA